MEEISHLKVGRWIEFYLTNVGNNWILEGLCNRFIPLGLSTFVERLI